VSCRQTDFVYRHDEVAAEGGGGGGAGGGREARKLYLANEILSRARVPVCVFVCVFVCVASVLPRVT